MTHLAHDPMGLTWSKHIDTHYYIIHDVVSKDCIRIVRVGAHLKHDDAFSQNVDFEIYRKHRRFVVKLTLS